jgi:transcriptional regulator with XRE-family HTH domain
MAWGPSGVGETPGLGEQYPIGYIDFVNIVRALREQVGISQAALARAGGTSQPTIAAYEADRKSPTLNTVRRLARSVGLEATVEYHPPMTREERRSLALHRAIGRRLLDDPAAVLARARRNVLHMKAQGAGGAQLLREWQVLLDRPLPALVRTLTDPDPWARELRQVTPFAGILAAQERARIYGEFAAEERQGR